jgi:hypothetical protein
MRSNVPSEGFTGSGNVGTSWQTLVPYTNLLQRCPRWLLWVTNDGPAAVNVQFTASPDGIHPDMDSLSSFACPSGQAVCLQGDGLHRYWSISAQAVSGTCAVSWGITMDLHQ